MTTIFKKMCNHFYITVEVILKQAAAWFLIPASSFTFSTDLQMNLY